MQKLEKCLPVTPTFSKSLKRKQVCGTISGFAGNSKTTQLPITLWKSTTDAIVKNKSSRHLQTTGYLDTDV
jgi:hypothetical protein